MVSTRLESNQKGHAWLFGSLKDASCWIAAPAHVFRGSNGSLQKGILYLGEGWETQINEIPIQPDPNIDLVFAPIKYAKRCTDRLGIADLSRLIEEADDVKLTILNEDVRIGFKVRVKSLTLSGREIAVEPKNQQDKLKQGYSGGLISLSSPNKGDSDLPIGMLLRVCDVVKGYDSVIDDFSDEAMLNPCDNEHHYGIALRFDEIRRLFINHLSQPLDQKTKVPKSDSRNITLISTTGKTLEATEGPASIFSNNEKNGCWRVRSDKFAQVSAHIRFSGKPIKKIKVLTCMNNLDEENPLGVGIEYKTIDTEVWSSIRYCRSNANSKTIIDCSFAPRGGVDHYLLRFKSKNKNGVVTIGKVIAE